MCTEAWLEGYIPEGDEQGKHQAGRKKKRNTEHWLPGPAYLFALVLTELSKDFNRLLTLKTREKFCKSQFEALHENLEDWKHWVYIQPGMHGWSWVWQLPIQAPSPCTSTDPISPCAVSSTRPLKLFEFETPDVRHPSYLAYVLLSINSLFNKHFFCICFMWRLGLELAKYKEVSRVLPSIPLCA